VGILFLDEISDQPSAWRKAAALAREMAGLFPRPSARVIAFGCGTSLYVAQSYVMLREARGQGEGDAFPASEIPERRQYDCAVAISRSGTTAEVVQALERLSPRIDTLAVYGVGDTPVPRIAAKGISLDFAVEKIRLQVRFPATALALLRASLGDDLDLVARDAEQALTMPLPIDPTRFEHFVFLGTGWTAGLANEAALNVEEVAEVWVEAYAGTEYRHGPLRAATARTVVWGLGPVPNDVLRNAAARGTTVVHNSLDPMAQLVLIERTAVALAQARGLDPDRMSSPYLT